jgi:hypothetical protein
MGKQPTSGACDYLELGTQLRDWDGELASATTLRERIRTFPAPQRQGECDEERTVMKLVSTWKKRDRNKLARLATEDGLAPLLLPLLGDPALAPWPYADPFSIPDDEAITWLRALRACGLVNEPMRRFARVLFGTRRRATWIPAADALAELAIRDAETLGFLAAEWRRWFPAGLPTKWPGHGLGAEVEAIGTRKHQVHRPRHILRAVCSWLARGGVPAVSTGIEGISVARFSRMSLPKDPADASAVLLGLQALFDAPTTRDSVAQQLGKRLRECRPDPQTEEVLRGIADRASQDGSSALAQRIREHLATPSWRRAHKAARIDALASWIETAAWSKQAGRHREVQAMRAACPEAATALALRVDGRLPDAQHCPVSTLLARLRTLLDANTFLTTPWTELAPAALEALYLLPMLEPQSLAWSRLAARAVGAIDPHASLETAGGRELGLAEEGQVGIALALARIANDVPQLLLHEHRMAPEVVFALAREAGRSSEGAQHRVNEKLARQIAVQMERLLREAPDDAERVRLLWKLARSAPPDRTFTELLEVLRVDPQLDAQGDEAVAKEQPWLAGVVQGFVAQCELRANWETVGAPAQSLRDGYGQLLAALKPPTSAGSEARPPWCALPAALEHAVAGLTSPLDPLDSWLVAMEALLFGKATAAHTLAERRGGIQAWLGWLDIAPSSLEPAWSKLSQRLRRIASSKGHTPAEDEGIQEAVRAIKIALASAPWLERTLIHGALDELLAWNHTKVEARILLEQRTEALNEALGKPDVDATLCIAERSGWRPPPQLTRAVHRLFLREDKASDARKVRDALARRDPDLEETLALDALDDAMEKSDMEAIRSLLEEARSVLPREAFKNGHIFLHRWGRRPEAEALRESLVGPHRDLARELTEDALDDAERRVDPLDILELVRTSQGLLQPERIRKAHALLLERGKHESATTLRQRIHGSGDAALWHTLTTDALDGAVDRGDEEAVDPLLTCWSEDVPKASIRRAHEFLLDGLAYKRADKLRKDMQSRIALPWSWTRFKTLAVGVPAGTLLVLDLGTAWNEVLVEGGSCSLIVILGLIASFALLVGDASRHIPGFAESPRQRVWRICRRVFPTYVVALVWALVVSWFILWSLQGASLAPESATPIRLSRQLPLWTSLSLFLGLFMGLLLQGKRFLSDK